MPGGSVTITPDTSSCKAGGGLFQEHTDWLLHPGIWQDNPQGIFTEYNPLVT